jgi:hypothetical protein
VSIAPNFAGASPQEFRVTRFTQIFQNFANDLTADRRAIIQHIAADYQSEGNADGSISMIFLPEDFAEVISELLPKLKTLVVVLGGDRRQRVDRDGKFAYPAPCSMVEESRVRDIFDRRFETFKLDNWVKPELKFGYLEGHQPDRTKCCGCGPTEKIKVG